MSKLVVPICATVEYIFQEAGQYPLFDSQMALELSSMVLLSKEACDQTQKRATIVKVAALKAMAAGQTSANGRNYYLTQVEEHDNYLDVTISVN